MPYKRMGALGLGFRVIRRMRREMHLSLIDFTPEAHVILPPDPQVRCAHPECTFYRTRQGSCDCFCRCWQAVQAAARVLIPFLP